MNKIFLTLSFAAFVAFLVLFVLFPGTQKFLFFRSMDDFGADFFNICRYVACRDPYGNTINGISEHAGLPLGYLWFLIFAQTADYATMILQDCWQNLNGCMIPFAVYSAINLGVFVWSVLAFSSQYKLRKIYLLPIFLSSILIFTLERGNSILLMAGLVNLFLLYYNSDSSCKKITAIFLLSVVGLFKVVPGILCLLYLKDRRFKEFGLLAVVTIFLAFIPFIFFKGGVDNVLLIPERMAYQVDMYGITFTCYRFGFMSFAMLLCTCFGNTSFLSFGYFAPYLMLVLSVALFFLSKDKKRAPLYLLFILALFAGSANVYNALYLFPLLIHTLASKDSFSKGFILFLFLWIVQPVQFVYEEQSVSFILANVSALALWVYVVVSDMFKNIHYIVYRSEYKKI